MAFKKLKTKVQKQRPLYLLCNSSTLHDLPPFLLSYFTSSKPLFESKFHPHFFFGFFHFPFSYISLSLVHYFAFTVSCQIFQFLFVFCCVYLNLHIPLLNYSIKVLNFRVVSFIKPPHLYGFLSLLVSCFGVRLMSSSGLFFLEDTRKKCRRILHFCFSA